MQKTYQWRNTLGALAYDCVEGYFQERKDILKNDDERAAHVDELLKMGGKLPFLYVRIRTNEESGKVSTFLNRRNIYSSDFYSVRESGPSKDRSSSRSSLLI